MLRTVGDVIVDAPVVFPNTRGEEVYELFSDDEDLLVVPVVENDRPVGLISRNSFFLKMADRHGRALFARRPVTFVMNKAPLQVDASTPVEELNKLIVRDEPAALMEGFIITYAGGYYAGVGTTLALFSAMARQAEERNHKLSALAEQLGRSRIDALSASKAKSDFLATMSHEIRTPLNGVLGVAQLLMESGLTEDQAELARVINDSGQILLRILNDVLDLSKIEAGKMDLSKESFAVRDLVVDTKALWSERATAKDLDFVIDVTSHDTRELVGDPVRIKQILFNLISNAIKFTDDGAVRATFSFVDLGRRRTSMRVEVRDSGCGIPEDAQASLFESFSQVDADTTRRHGGTGLGLTICKRLVELMGGSIGFESVADQGSTFWFDIPLNLAEEKPQPAAPVMEPDQTSLPASRKRVLIAEDNIVNQTVTAGFLKLKKIDFEIVENGQQALDAVQKQNFDAVLMDVQMPVMDGLDATRAIRRLGSDVARIPIIALTANAMSGDQQVCLEAGMTGFVAKPISKDNLYKALEEAFEPGARHASRAA
ncbi:ATP-binding protein [Maricaulis sp. D1M11]|uniref:ATP-binding protein n=1 Tax=Maricaulis sp. D1M11 TaxID=3076117 RepID=UPI0039B44D0D